LPEDKIAAEQHKSTAKYKQAQSQVVTWPVRLSFSLVPLVFLLCSLCYVFRLLSIIARLKRRVDLHLIPVTPDGELHALSDSIVV
jgi:hypothetical protein